MPSALPWPSTLAMAKSLADRCARTYVEPNAALTGLFVGLYLVPLGFGLK